MTSAIIGLIGIVVGGAIAAFAQQLRPSSRSVRGAARLLHDELDLALTYARSTLKTGSWQPGDRAFLENAWLDRRDLLAAELGLGDWTSVKKAYQAVGRLRAARPPRNDPLSMSQRATLESAANEIEMGRKVLHKLSGPLPTLTQMLRRKSHGRAPKSRNLG